MLAPCCAARRGAPCRSVGPWKIRCTKYSGGTTGRESFFFHGASREAKEISPAWWKFSSRWLLPKRGSCVPELVWRHRMHHDDKSKLVTYVLEKRAWRSLDGAELWSDSLRRRILRSRTRRVVQNANRRWPGKKPRVLHTQAWE